MVDRMSDPHFLKMLQFVTKVHPYHIFHNRKPDVQYPDYARKTMDFGTSTNLASGWDDFLCDNHPVVFIIHWSLLL